MFKVSVIVFGFLFSLSAFSTEKINIQLDPDEKIIFGYNYDSVCFEKIQDSSSQSFLRAVATLNGKKVILPVVHISEMKIDSGSLSLDSLGVQELMIRAHLMIQLFLAPKDVLSSFGFSEYAQFISEDDINNSVSDNYDGSGVPAPFESIEELATSGIQFGKTLIDNNEIPSNTLPCDIYNNVKSSNLNITDGPLSI